jgi:uncharacterized protein YjbI with pentapeptide repeats
MHSRDPQKSDSEFQQEFERILKEATDRNEVADFTLFVFPSANYYDREFPAKCEFVGAVFTQEADFSGATFTQGVHFIGAKFTQEADFSDATFTQEANFNGAELTRGANFRLATFTRRANFALATFTQEANFSYAKFTQEADFSDATFTQNADFRLATFTRRANFALATFTQEANFNGAKLTRGANFRRATFTQKAGFAGATFTQEADFEHAKFLAPADFRETTFRNDDKLSRGAVFCMAEFSHPEAIVFYKTNLCQALFHNCDVSKVTFSSVEWRTRKGSGRRMLFEEEVDLKYASALETGRDSDDERDYGLIAELYQQLKKNYDERKDYSAAGDFHYGEMEMKRLHSRSQRPWVRRLHQHLGLVAWYKYASSYGESYRRPLGWLAFVLLVFTALYPLAGLRTAPPAFTAVTQQASPPMPATELSYCHFGEFVRAYPGPKWIAGAAFFGHSLMTTLAVTGLQKELRYEPVYPWGRALALVQLVLTSTLIALFLLALRRQFRR